LNSSKLLAAPDDFLTFQLQRLKPAILVMLYTGILIILLTITWDWTSLSENKLVAIYYRIPAALAIALILIPLYAKPYQRYLVDASLALSFTSFCCLAMNYLLLPERTPYLPAILFYFMSSFLILAPIVPSWKLILGVFIPVPVITLFLLAFNQTEHYLFSILMHVIPTHAFLLLTALQVKRNAEQNYILFCQTYHLATLDSLTNLLNRGAWEQQADLALQRSVREHSTFAVVTGDIDLFKRINDQFGHPTGDAVIKSVADCLKQHLRNYDLVGRLGGDEFIIALPSIEKATLDILCERMRNAIEGLIIHSETGKRVNISLSLGVSFIEKSSAELYQLMKQSDLALYKSKHNGRNRVEFYSHPPLIVT
jgi:diguanylate cyclase (GGDEF)-like protein